MFVTPSAISFESAGNGVIFKVLVAVDQWLRSHCSMMIDRWMDSIGAATLSP